MGSFVTHSLQERISLYPGEEIRMGANYPGLVRFSAGHKNKPLVVFITGGGVLARIAYGHPENRRTDFLAHWLEKSGYPFLAISYPLDNPVFSTVHPEFSVRDWGAQTAEIASQIIVENSLVRQVLVLAWSMAGRVAEPISVAFRKQNIDVELFVAMAASTALPGLLPALDLLKPSVQGLARVDDGFSEWLLQSLDCQSAEAGHSVIHPDLFRTDFMGDLPVNLAATSKRYSEGSFVSDPLADALDVGASNYAFFPPVALITHTSAIDARHALIDRGAWAFYIQQTLCERHIWPHAERLNSLSTDSWLRLIKSINEAAERLTVVMPGSHLFFVGERGARDTVAALQFLRDRQREVQSDLESLLL